MKRLLAVGEGLGSAPFPTANQPFHTQLLYICDGDMVLIHHKVRVWKVCFYEIMELGTHNLRVTVSMKSNSYT